jgi:hypothetical protein
MVGDDFARPDSQRVVPGRHQHGEEGSSALRAGRIFDTPSLEGYTFVDFRLPSSTRRFSMRSVDVRLRSYTCRKRVGEDMNVGTIEITKVPKSSKQRPVKTRTVSTRVTEAEYSALHEQACSTGKTVCDWARECIVQRLAKDPQKLEEHLFTELVGIQLLLMNTLGPIVRGERMAAEELAAVFREVQARKARKAQEILSKRLNREVEARDNTPTSGARTAIS